MFVTFMRCEWRGGSRRLIKAAGMLIGRGHCCPLCSALSYWASVAPVKGQRTDLKSVTLTPHTLQHPPPYTHTHTYVHRLSHLTPPPFTPHPFPSHSFLSPEENGALLLLSFPLCCLIRWLALPSPLRLIQCWGSNFITGFLFSLLWSLRRLHFQPGQARWLCAEVREVSERPKRICVFFYCLEILIKWAYFKLYKIVIIILACRC